MSFFSTDSAIGTDALQGLFDTNGDMDQAWMPQLSQLFQTAEGEKFFNACSYLNTPQKQRRSKQMATDSMEASIVFLIDNVSELHTQTMTLAEASARLFQFVADMIEIQSLLPNANRWADALPRATHRPAVAAWESEPGSLDKFSAA